jgi:outer membrane protein W
MKKIVFVFLAVLLFFSFLSATEYSFSFRGYSFHPSEEAFQDIYGAGFGFGLESDVQLIGNIDFRVAVGSFQKKGEMTLSKEEIKLSIVPVEIGLRYRILSGGIRPYAGAGLGYFRFKEKTPIGTAITTKLGYFAHTGVMILVVKGLYLDGFLNYSSCKVKPATIEVNIGGFSMGVGVGYRFGKS